MDLFFGEVLNAKTGSSLGGRSNFDHFRTPVTLPAGCFWTVSMYIYINLYVIVGKSIYLENLVPIVLGTFQSAWKVCHFRSRISTVIYGTVRLSLALFPNMMHQKMKCIFLVRVCV